jgi:hypothetical protein
MTPIEDHISLGSRPRPRCDNQLLREGRESQWFVDIMGWSWCVRWNRGRLWLGRRVSEGSRQGCRSFWKVLYGGEKGGQGDAIIIRKVWVVMKRNVAVRVAERRWRGPGERNEIHLAIRVDTAFDGVGDPVERDKLDDGLVRRGDVAPQVEFFGNPVQVK